MSDKDDSQMNIISTKRQIKNFKKNFVWKDIQEEIKVWKKGFEIERANIVDDAESNNPSTASVLLHLGDVNGRIKAVNYILSLPDVFLQILEDNKNDTDSE